jgi:hypothetical protein
MRQGEIVSTPPERGARPCYLHGSHAFPRVRPYFLAGGTGA